MASLAWQGILHRRISGQSAYVAAVVVGGLACAAASLGTFPTEGTGVLVALIVIGGLAQFLSLSLFGPSSVSLSFPFAFLSLLWFGPAVAIATNAASVAVHAFYPARRPWYKAAFNLGSLSLAAAMAAVVYQVSGGKVPPDGFVQSLVPTSLSMVTYFLVNTLTVSGAVSLSTGQPLLRVWVTSHRWLSIYYGALALLALAAATTFQRGEHLEVLLAIPLLAVPWAFTRLLLDRAKELVEKRRRLAELGLLYRISVEVNNCASMDETLTAVLSGARDVAHPDALAIFLFDGTAGGYRLAKKTGFEGIPGAPAEFDLTDQDLASLGAARPATALSSLVWRRSVQGREGVEPATHGYLPLRMNGQLLGIMRLTFNRKPKLGEDDARLLATLLEYGAVAIDRQNKSQALIESYQRLFQTHESVRKEVSASLHGPLQTKLLVLWHRLGQLESPSSLEECQEQAMAVRSELAALQEYVRTLSAQLHPAIVKVGLTPALRSLANRFEGMVRIDTWVASDLEALHGGATPVPEELRLILYRVAAEALNNVVKHANATQVWIRAWGREGQVCLSVEDDGKGFRMENTGRGIGRQIMRDYANAAGGTVTVESAPSRGTKVMVTLPLPRDGREAA